MTVFAIRHKQTLQFWTGLWRGWSRREADAKTFVCHADASAAGFAGCHADPSDTEIVPLSRFEDQEIAASNDAIVKAHSERWLRNG